MMLLPAGRSNGDVHALQNNNTQKPQCLTRTSSPQLTANPKNKTSVTENGYTTATAATATAQQIYGNSLLAAVGETTAAATATAGSHYETGTAATFSNSNPTTTTAAAAAATLTATASSGNWQEIDRHLHLLQTKLKDGWSVHVGKEGRLYYRMCRR